MQPNILILQTKDRSRQNGCLIGQFCSQQFSHAVLAYININTQAQIFLSFLYSSTLFADHFQCLHAQKIVSNSNQNATFPVIKSYLQANLPRTVHEQPQYNVYPLPIRIYSNVKKDECNLTSSSAINFIIIKSFPRHLYMGSHYFHWLVGIQLF